MATRRNLPAGIAQDVLTVLDELSRRAYSQQVSGETVAAAVALEREALAALPDETPRLHHAWAGRRVGLEARQIGQEPPHADADRERDGGPGDLQPELLDRPGRRSVDPGHADSLR